MDRSDAAEKIKERVVEEPKIIRNRARCTRCGDVIESKHRHDFRSCKCGALSVDGGKDYLRRLTEMPGEFEELSETEAVK